MYIYTFVQCGPPISWAQTLGLPSSCAWISVSLVSCTWACKPLRLQPLSICCYRPLHSHAQTPRADWDSPGLQQLRSPGSHPHRHTCQQVSPLETLWSLQQLLALPLIFQSDPCLWSHPWRHPLPSTYQAMSPAHWLIWLDLHQ